MIEKKEGKDLEEKAYCEKYKEWVLVAVGCKHPKEYCKFRTQCLLYFNSKFKDF